MSTAVNVYSVPVDGLRAVPGSKNKKLLAAVRKQKSFLQMIDDIADPDDEDETPPTCAEAVAQIINGDKMDDRFGHVYGYAYEAICAELGAEAEPHWWSIVGAGAWFEQIDKALQTLGFPVQVTCLLYQGALIEIPDPDTYPGLGWWTADEIAAAVPVLDRLDLEKMAAKTAEKVKPVADAFFAIRAWITLAASRPGDWLIGVHS
jgi:hypothetical protein